MNKIIINSLLTISLCLIGNKSFSQNEYQGTVLNNKTLKPIEFVDVYNDTNFTLTNEQGKFRFITSRDSIKFNLIGYNKLDLSLKNLKINDTIYLESKAYELDEVVISKNNSTFKKMVKAIEGNFPSSEFKEEFFLRCILKKNNSIIKIQDLNGVIKRETLFSTSKNPMPKKNYTVFINNMRKAGYDEKDIEFELFNFNKILNALVSLYMSPKIYDFSEVSLKDSTLIKLNFEPKSLEETTTKGYYIVNTNDNSFNEVYLINDGSKGSFTEKRDIKYRTIKYEVLVSFLKDKVLDKNRIDNAKINSSVEVFDEENNKIKYDVSYILKTSKKYDSQLSLKNKVSLTKDIFKLKEDYNKEYWETNNILKLTGEMIVFLNSLDENKEYKLITNLKK
jgi:hypothetical protein